MLKRIVVGVRPKFTRAGIILAAARTVSITRGIAAPVNPVNVESFTLDDAIVSKHALIHGKWIELSNELAALSKGGQHRDILTAVEKGFTLLRDVGAEDSPVHCEPMLLMTQAQANYNLKQWAAATQSASRALDLVKQGRGGDADEGRLREIEEFIAYTQLEQGDAQDALARFDALLAWVASGSRKSLPMVQVVAVNMKRTLQSGKARALLLLARGGGGDTVDRRALLGQSLDLFIESLSEHVDAKDVEATKMALDGAVLCYCALGELTKAQEACEKLTNWCRRHNDVAGLELAATRVAELQLLNKNDV